MKGLMTGVFMGAVLVSIPGTGSCGSEVSARLARFDGDRAAAVSYTFDDGFRDQYTLAVPLLNQAGFKGTFFVIPGRTAATVEEAVRKQKEKRAWGGICWPELKIMADQGHEIASHSWSHPGLQKLTPAEVESELVKSYDAIKAGVGRAPLTFAFPFNQSTPDIKAAALKHYVACRSFQTGVGGGSTVEFLNQWADTQVREKGYGILMFHAISNGYAALSSPDILRDHLGYVKLHERDIWVDTFATVMRYEKEREDAKLVVTPTADGAICLLSGTLDPVVFNVPLTIVVDVPGVVSARAESDGTALAASVVGNAIRIRAVPGVRPIKLVWKQSIAPAWRGKL